MKKYLPVLLLLFLMPLAVFTQQFAPGSLPEQDNPESLWIWSATGSQPYIEEYFSMQHPEITIELDTVPFELLLKLLEDPSSCSGPCPDILLGEEKTLQLLQARNLALPLDSLVTDGELSRLVPYTVNLARGDDGRLYGLLYAVTPVATCYRRSMAREFLGTDDPVEVGAWFSSLDTLIGTARRISSESGGEARLAPGAGDIETLLYAAKNTPWVVNGRLNIDRTTVSQVEVFRECLDEGLTGNAEMWGEKWFREMTDDGKTLAYFFPLWGYEYVIKPNTADNGADWALCPAPVHRFWGAQIFSIISCTDRMDDALLFLKTMCLSPSYELWLNEQVREVPAHIDALDALSGEQDMATYRDIALRIEGSRGSSLDMEFSALFAVALKPYYAGKITLDEALDAFRSAVREQYPGILTD